MSDLSQDHLRWAMALATSRDPQGVAEAHGLITGLVAGQPNMEAHDLWLHWMSLHLDHDPGDVDQPALMADALSATKSTLGSEDMDFQPLVPAQTQPLAQRTEGLAQWCSGFLAGFGVSGGRLSDAEATEALSMLGEIARAETLADSSDDEAQMESEEEAWAELLEFVKVAVLLIHEERRLSLTTNNKTMSDRT